MKRFPLRWKCCSWVRAPTEDLFMHGYGQTARDKERQHQAPSLFFLFYCSSSSSGRSGQEHEQKSTDQ